VATTRALSTSIVFETVLAEVDTSRSRSPLHDPDITERYGMFDVVIVGGGSAGAVLANRLSADPSRNVLLLEAGAAYPPGDNPEVLLDPARVGGDIETDWGYTARGGPLTPVIPVPRGKALGGSSAVNATVALRARCNDFDKWTAHGIKGWSFPEVFDTYKTLENTPDGDDRYRGRTGVFPIRQRSYGELTPSLRAFIDASVHLGFDKVGDPNGPVQAGVFPYPLNTVDNVRQSTALTYLSEEVRRRPNLSIVGHSEIDRVVFDGTTATAVVTPAGAIYHAADEVILSAGAYGSPAILMRSGIGPADELRALDIDVIADLPVGKRLQDHPFYYNTYALRPGSLSTCRPWRALCCGQRPAGPRTGNSTYISQRPTSLIPRTAPLGVQSSSRPPSSSPIPLGRFA
jgi:choline dehydrogenase